MLISCCDTITSVLSWLKPTVYYQMDVVLLGLPNSGKTSFVDALTKGKVNSDMIPTMSMEVSKFALDSSYNQRQLLKRQQQQKQIIRRSKSTNFQSDATETDRLLNYEDTSKDEDLQYYPERIYIKCYDLSGQVRYQDSLWKNCVTSGNDCNLIIYVIDVSDELNILTSKQKLIDIILLNNDPERGGKQLPVLIIGNKMDLVLDSFHTFLGGFVSNLTMNNKVPTNSNTGGTSESNGNGETSSKTSKTTEGKKKRSVILGGKYKSGKNKSLANNIAKLNITKSEVLAQFLGIEVNPVEDEIYLNTNNGSRKEKLEFDIGVFTVSLKFSDSLETEIEGYDTLDDVKDWIFGVN